MDYRNANYNSRIPLYPSSTAPYSTEDGSAHNWSYADKRAKNVRKAATAFGLPSVLAPAVLSQNGDQQGFPTQSFIPDDFTSTADNVPYSIDDGLSQADQGTAVAAYDDYPALYSEDEVAQQLKEYMGDLHLCFPDFFVEDTSGQPITNDNDYSQEMVLPPALISDDSFSENSSLFDAQPDINLQWPNAHPDIVMQGYNNDQDVHYNDPPFFSLIAPMDINIPLDFAGNSNFYSQTGYANQVALMVDGETNSESLRANHSHMASRQSKGKQFWLNSDDESTQKKVVKSENTENNTPSTSNVIASPTNDAETDKSRFTPGPSREIFSSESPPSSGEDELQDDTADESPSPAMAIDRSSGRPIVYKHRLLARNPSPRTVTPRNTSSRYTQSKDVVGTDAIRNAGKNRRKTEARFRCTWGNCTSEFTRRHNLNNHIKTHLGQAGTHCEKCGKELAQSSRRRHENKCNVKITPAESP